MFGIRAVRGYIVLIAGAAIFIALRLAAGAPLMESDPNYAHIASEVEPQLLVFTLALMGIAVGWGSLRGILIATAFSLPPLLLYFTFYPLWIIFLMLLMVPMLGYAALRSWLPSQKAG
jgi:uncharacterized membrane protein